MTYTVIFHLVLLTLNVAPEEYLVTGERMYMAQQDYYHSLDKALTITPGILQQFGMTLRYICFLEKEQYLGMGIWLIPQPIILTEHKITMQKGTWNSPLLKSN